MLMVLLMGASTIKYTEKVLLYTKSMMFLVKRLKAIAKCCSNWIFFNDALNYYVRYSNIRYQDEILKIIIKSTAQKVMAQSGFGCRFHAPKYLKLEFFFLVP